MSTVSVTETVLTRPTDVATTRQNATTRERWSRPEYRTKVLKFVGIGILNTGFAYASFAALYTVFRQLPYMAVLVVSRELSVVFAYILYRRLVFKSGGPIAREFAKFWMVYAGGLMLNLLALPFLVELAHVRVLVAQALVLVLTVMSSWIGHNRFSFSKSLIAEDPPSA